MSHIKNLNLSDFRSYTSLNIDFSKNLSVFYGSNGAGKTNIVEAISFFAPGRGLRQANLKDILFLNSHNNVASSLWTSHIQFHDGNQFAAGCEFNYEGSKKLYKINQTTVKTSSYFKEWINCVWLTPEHDRIFMNDPATRRKFIDRLVFAVDEQHAARLNRYEKLARERQAILANYNASQQWLDSVEENMACEAIAIYFSRWQLHKKLNTLQAQITTEFPNFLSSMNSEIDEMLENTTAQTIESFIKNKFRENRFIDASSGTTKFGPHRSDWNLTYCEKNKLAPLCSTGEQKILLISFFLVFLRLIIQSEQPYLIILLDDIVAHLDFHHRMVLFEHIKELQKAWTTNNPHKAIHVFFTGTDESFFQGLNDCAEFFYVDNSVVTQREKI